ncbi:DNA replication/repair protein RecF [Celerinatantimonas diazotrophica]|uniref:DNA replication and repair protein RecF n=1 Tax=Celerinatantimonas diazotrophica TaxID=412034 RepID=A0A4R1KH09_9GAMM|nr:DNA replication/repair protein RecF [Celerinatantimonas diazotrophica]TCK63353.1 DNA replication and repair protein RecF [Celerinatantimonas diazotrophica]CAG9294897.1 DNA replication and repair protein RecF [Celerinatantimonas diazotrophica]
MAIDTLTMTNFRNISQEQMQFSPNLNVIVGDNGSGKTSILEALYLLGFGRSFRSSRIRQVVQHQQPQLVLFAQANQHRIGLCKQISGETQLRIDGETVRTQAELSKILPVQLIHPEGYSVVNGSPRYRRAYLDWGVFHEEQQFQALMHRYKRLLKQRNALLKQRASYQQLSIWDRELVTQAESIRQMRQAYFAQLVPEIQQIAEDFLPEYRFEFNLYHGWNHDSSLAEILEQNYEREKQMGFTLAGAHKADIRIKTEQGNAAETISRGQLKLLVCALLLAQGQHTYRVLNKPTIYLIDDFAAELDPTKRALLAQYLQRNSAQVFITAIEPQILEGFDLTDSCLFHVKQGNITQQ